MVFYGEWTQGPDFARTSHAQRLGRMVAASDVHAGGDAQFADVTGLANAATAAAESEATDSGLFGGTALTGLNVDAGAGVSNVYGEYRAGTMLSFPSLALPSKTLPSGAIGIEWEATECALVGAVWDFTGSGSGQTWYTEGDIAAFPTEAHLTIATDQARIDAYNTTYLAPYPISAGTFTIGPDGVDIPPAVDLTPYLRPDGKFLWSIRIAPLGFGYVYADFGKRASAQLDVKINPTYTLHPPRHRFVYETEPVPTPPRRPPHLRIVQRGNDGLGVTGGRRIIGTKTIQSSNRRGTAIR